MGKNLVVRLHVYLMCFLLAFSTPYAYASAAPKLDFIGIANFVRDAGGATADYLFRRSANDPNYNAANDEQFETKSHKVSNAALGLVAFKRILGLTAFGVGATFLVDEVTSALQSEGWTVDKPNQEIYKMVEGGNVIYFYSNDPEPLSTLDAALRKHLQAIGVPSDRYGNYSLVNPAQMQSFFQANANSNLKSGNVEFKNVNNPANQTFGVRFRLPQPQKQLATPDDVAAVLPDVSPAQIEALMKSPDFDKEGHAPTANAASKAAPKSETPPKDPPKDSANKCPAGQVFDADTSKCKSTNTPQCPVGQVYDFAKKKCFSPKPDDDDEEPEGEDWPEFCEWAAPVCEFIEWAKQDVDKFDVEKVEVEDTADDAQSIMSQILTLGYVSGGVKSCPSTQDLSFEFMGQSIGFELSYAPLCEMLLTARPVVIAIAYFQAAKIVFVGRRD